MEARRRWWGRWWFKLTEEDRGGEREWELVKRWKTFASHHRVIFVYAYNLCVHPIMDDWTGLGSIKSTINGSLSWGEESLHVHQCIANGDWDFSKISLMLPDQVLEQIRSHAIQLNNVDQDCVAWKFSPKGEFNLMSAYELADGRDPQRHWTSDWDWIWQANCTPIMQTFLWLCAHDRIPSASTLFSFGLQINSSRSRCAVHIESTIHILRDCKVAKKF